MTAPGCLVASEHEFASEVPIRASIVRNGLADFQIGNLVRWSEREQSLTFQVTILDPNVEDVLSARWVLHSASGAELLSPCNEETGEDRLIPVNGKVERDLLFTLEPSQVRENGCYRLELSVSNAFSLDCIDVRQDPGTAPLPSKNVDVATWFLLVDDSPVPGIAAMCEALAVEVDG